MKSRALPSTEQRAHVSRMASDPAYLDQLTRQQFGLDAKTMDAVLNVMMSVSQGNMPDAKHMAPIYQMARQQYGWGQERVQSEMRKAIGHASPQERVAAYLSANNLERVDPAVYSKAIGLVQHGLRADMEVGIMDRLSQTKTANAPERRYEGMQADKRVLEDSKDRSSLRQMLEGLTGHNSKPSYESRVERVLKARSQLADRVEIQAAQRAAGHEPSLRESLSNSYDEQHVAKASEDLGMGNPIQEAASVVEAESAHTSPDFDVTKDL